MNKQKFIECLRKPSQITSDQLSEIESLVREYPYFQDGRTLLAKAKKAINPDQAAKFISTAAVYASDRAMLKKYLNQELFFLKPLKIEPEKEDQVSEKPISQNKPKIEGKISTELTEIVHLKNEIELTKVEATIPDSKAKIPAVKETQVVRAIEINSNFGNLPTKSTDNLDDLIAEIMHDVEELKKSKARFRAIEAKIEEEDAIKKVISRTTSGKKKTLTNSSDSVSAEQVDKSIKKPEKVVSKPKSETSKKSKEKEQIIDKTEVQTLKKEEQEEIIKEFIKTEPQIKKIKPGKENTPIIVNDLADKSTRFHVDVTSEYLAEIYISQGKQARAIEIYESLGLKFPEKSAYFAALIKILKNKV